MWAIINETRKQIEKKEQKCEAKYFLIFENNCFQSRESHQLFTQIRV